MCVCYQKVVFSQYIRNKTLKDICDFTFTGHLQQKNTTLKNICICEIQGYAAEEKLEMFAIFHIFVFDKLDLDVGGGGQAVSKVLVTQMLQTVDAKNHFSLLIIIITSKINIEQFLYFQKTTCLVA